MKRLSLRGAVLMALVLSPLTLRAQPAAGGSPLVVEAFAVPRNGDLIVLPLTIAGSFHWFALYTGSSNSVFDKSLRPLLDQPIGAGGASTGDDSLPIELFPWPKNVRLGGMSVSSRQPVVLADLSPVRRSTGYEVEGLLGMDFLKAQILRIDFDAGRLWFLGEGGGQQGIKLPLTFANGGLPSVSVDMGDGPQDCLVNTGSIGVQDGELTSAAIDNLVIRSKARLFEDGGSAFAGGRDSTRSAAVAALRLGGFEHANLTFSEAPMNMLGLGYWSRYVVTLDFRNECLYVARGQRFDRPSSAQSFGLNLIRERELTFVDSIKRGSLAERSGLRLTDLVLNVGGRPAGTTSIQALASALGEGGGCVPVIVQRQAAIKVVDVVIPSATAR